MQKPFLRWDRKYNLGWNVRRWNIDEIWSDGPARFIIIVGKNNIPRHPRQMGLINFKSSAWECYRFFFGTFVADIANWLSGILTHVTSPLRSYARIHVENWEDCCHLQIHYSAAHQANHQKYRAGDFKHFNLPIMEHVGGQGDGKENTDYRYYKNGDSVENWSFALDKQ